MSAYALAASTLRMHTCAAPAAVTVQVNVHPFAWNMGSVHRYRSPGAMDQCVSVPIEFTQALRWVIITPFGREVVPLV